MRATIAYGVSGLAMTIALMAGGSAFAQQSNEVEEVIVTGSLIAGSPEDAALPVDVIGAEELQKQGSPTTLDLIKGLSVSSGVLGDTNQFESRAQGSEGSGSINLRGLGPHRTLVLINGRRMAPNPFAGLSPGAIDTNIIPTAAIGRVEVLKDGAAATYGSDAIGGVVNFITRTNFDGLEVGGSFRYIDGSEGDYTANAVWGHDADDWNVLIAAGVQHRSELRVIDRDWANSSFTRNPQAGWSTTNAVTGIRPVVPDGVDADAVNDLGTTFLDPGCSSLGGIVAGTACRFQFLQYDNLVETEDRFQIYGEVNADLGESTRLHVEGFYSKTDVPEFATSPGYGGIQGPTSALTGGQPLGGYFVPIGSPALTTSGGARTVIGALLPSDAVGAYLPTTSFRTFSFGGNPRFDNGPGRGTREYDAFRLSASLAGKFDNGVTWDTGLTYSQEIGQRNTLDALVSRLQLAMRGYGSVDSDAGGCTAAETSNFTTGAGSASLGCHWFNPFSSSIPINQIGGQVNNVTITGASPAVINSKDLVSWIYQPVYTKVTQAQLVADVVLTGPSGMELAGGEVMWAAGAQFRRSFYKLSNNDFGNSGINPCVETPFNGNKNCTVPQGPFHFLGALANGESDADVSAFFGELQVPVTDTLNFQLAARYESYGGSVGSTFNPKISGKWQATENLALRGSMGTTFRGPPQNQLTNAFGTSFEFLLPLLRYTAVNNYGNPSLEPETATTYSFGTVFELGDFKATLDYWAFEFDNPIVNENAPELISALTGGAGLAANCANPAYAGLRARFSYAVPTDPNNCTTLANIASISVRAENGAAVQTSGLDLLANWRVGEIFGGRFSVGTTLTYILEYKTEAQKVEGISVATAFDGVGKLNSGTTAYPLPQLKGNVFAEWTVDDHNLRATMNYVDEYKDQRFATGSGSTIDAFMTVDLDYRWLAPYDTTFVVSVDNVTDEEPPFARLNLSYDPFTASGLGRTFKVSATKKF